MTTARTLPPAAARREALDARFRPWTPMTLSQMLGRAAADFGDRPYLITDERAHTYAEIHAWAERIAAGLVALGVEVGDHVALVMANHPEFAPIKFGIAQAGATCIPVNYLFRATELGYVIGQSDAKVLITMDRYRDLDYLGALDELAPGWERDGGGEAFPQLQRVVVFSPDGDGRAGAMTLGNLEAAATEEAREELTRRAAQEDAGRYSDILYTSGTTGSPKGVLLRHDQVVRMAYASAYQRALEDGRRLGYPMPMYHVFGYVECLLAVPWVGGAVVPQVAFDAAHALTQVARHAVNEVVAVPAVTMPLIAEYRRGDYDLSTVHTVFNSGGAAPASIWDDIREVFGDVELTTGYGMTETTAATTCVNPEDPEEMVRTTNGRVRHGGAAGDPGLGGLVAAYKAISLETGDDLPPGEQGHLLARGLVVTDGYYKKPEETELAFTEDGWLRTGDIGSVDADGILKLTGRLKESFRVGGEMVMPAEIEQVLALHPAVAQAHVVGIPHPRMGEIPCAWIIPSDAASPPEAGVLVEHCSGRLARYKVPKHIIVAQQEDLPVTATGRVQKFKLSELSVQRLQQTAGT